MEVVGREPSVRRGLTRRVALSGAGILLAVAVTVVALLIALREVEDAGRDALHAERAIALVSELERHAVETQTSTRGFAITGDPTFLAPSEQARQEGPALYAQLQQNIRGARERALLDELGQRLGELAERYEAFVELAQRDREAALQRVTEQRGAAVQAVRTAAGALSAQLTRRALSSDDAHDRAVAAAVIIGLIGSLITAALVATATIGLHRRVAQPLAAVAGTAHRLAAGDRTARAPTGGRDEIGVLQRSFNEMVDALEEREASLRQAREEAEQALAVNYAMLETSPDGLALMDHDATILFSNAAMNQIISDIIGRPARIGEEILDSVTISRLIEPNVEDPAAYRAAYDEALADPDAVHRTRYHVPKLGRTFLRILAPVRLASGERVGKLILTRDITPELDAERDAAITRQVIEASPDGIMLLDADGHALLASRRMDELMTEIMGEDVSMQEFTGEPGWTERVAARMEDPERFLREVMDLIEDPRSHPMVEFTVAETQRTYQRFVRPIARADGSLIGTVRLLRDVTAERAAERAKDDLMAAVSHELRTPLASILGFAELLETRELDAAVQRRYAATIHQEARRLTALVDDLIDLRLVEQGRLALAPEPVDLGALLREQIDLFDRRATEHEFRVDLPPAPVVVNVDRLRLGQVLANLLSNAVKYSPGGGVVETSVSLNGSNRVRVAIKDHGLGIPISQQNRLFQRFFRADRPAIRHIGGSGIGLALTRQLVEVLGGEIGFASREGEGSTFWIELPVSGAPAETG